MRGLSSIAAWAMVSLAASAPLFAQGKSQDHGKNGNAAAANNTTKTSNAGGSGRGGGSPSQTPFAAPAAIASSGSGVTPFSWIDNANLLAPGTVWVGLSATRWQNGGFNEVSFPVVDAAVAVGSRLQIGASVPRVMPNPTLAVDPGGLGTTFVNAKIGLMNNSEQPVRVSIAPTLEILSSASLQWWPAGQRRLQWGIPVSAEFDRSVARIYGSIGYFSPGIWYVGAGAGVQVTPRIGVAATLGRSAIRSSVADPTLPLATRNDVSTGVAIDFNSAVGVFSSVGRTFKTSTQNGAGTTLTVGVSLTAERIRFTP